MRVAFYGLALCVLTVVMTGVPIRADADQISTLTQQLLPPGVANTCAQLAATEFTPYVYDGALHSFEFTVPDTSYVAVAGTVGDSFVPLRFMTRRVSTSGALRIHVDIATTPIRGTLPIQVTLLSSSGPGSPTCLSVVSGSVGSGPVQNAATAMTTAVPTAVVNAPAPSSVTPGGFQISEVLNPTPQATTSDATGNGASTMSSGTATKVKGVAFASILQAPFDSICSSKEGTYRLWIVLFILYALIAAIALWSKWPAMWPSTRAREWRSVGVLIPLVLLLAFWYFSPVCRSVWWIPLAIAAIGALGSFAAYRDYSNVAQLLLLGPSKK